MQFYQLKSLLKNFTVFSISDIHKVDPTFHNQRLSEWQKKGYIKKIRQGWYMFADVDMNEPVLFLIANTIYKPSYVSLEMALSLYNLIPEGVYEITSITSKKTQMFKTTAGYFSYHHLKPALLFGYELRPYHNQHYLIADIEKTILDYLYFHPHIKTIADFEGLRFNAFEFKQLANITTLKKYLAVFKNTSLANRVKTFLTYLDYAQSY